MNVSTDTRLRHGWPPSPVHEVHRVEVDARLLLIGVGPMSNYEMERPSYHLFKLFKLSPSMTAEIGPFTRPTFFIKKLCVPYF